MARGAREARSDPGRPRSRVATGLCALVALALGLGACNGTQPGCGALATGLEMAAAQDAIRDRYSNIDDAYAAGFAPSHHYVTFAGMGMAVARVLRIEGGAFAEMLPEPVSVNDPNMLFYGPTGGAARVGIWPLDAPGSFTDPFADPPYRLIGWGYFVEYDPAARPALGCVPAAEWFIHEAGWHTSDGGFIATTPPGEPAGLRGRDAIALPPVLPAPATTAGPSGFLSVGVIWHRRYWDLHVWRNDGGFPGFGIFNTFGGPAFGAALPAGAFFFRSF